MDSSALEQGLRIQPTGLGVITWGQEGGEERPQGPGAPCLLPTMGARPALAILGCPGRGGVKA